MEFPEILANEPSLIKLLIFEDEKIHLPFHIECTPSDYYKIIVQRFRNLKLIDEYEVDYKDRLSELLKSEGIVFKDNRYIVLPRSIKV